jgi:hypothetical protein
VPAWWKTPGYGDPATWGGRSPEGSPEKEEPQGCTCDHGPSFKELQSGICEVCGLEIIPDVYSDDDYGGEDYE